jgi:P-type conjugative transfer protein TrbJ
MNRFARLVASAALAFAIGAMPARAIIVFDPDNYVQNVLQASYALRQIDNQIQSLQHEITMLENMAKNLVKLDYSALVPIQTALRQINQLMARAEGISFDLQQFEQTFARLYPKEYASTVTSDDLARDAKSRWQQSMDALRQTMKVQGQVVQNVGTDTDELGRLVTESQAAIGSLQASQAGNQLIALSTKQQLQTQGLLAAQYRAEALERSRAATSEEQARAQFTRFLGDGRAYSPAR